MTSTTLKKKVLIDFLWDWAEGNGEWGKLLVNHIVSHERVLTQIERNEVFDYFLQSIGLKSGLPDKKISKPGYIPSSKHVELVTLSEVKGVNRLAEGQAINFSKNLTLVFGENGTGKTGYGRILKALGFSYEADTTIYPNIYKSSKNQSAKIDYKKNNTPDIFNWTGHNKNKDLASISVFNNGCVQISLSESRELIVSPIGFHLFNLISTELNELLQLLEATKAKYSTNLIWADNLSNTTHQRQFIDSLSGKTTEQEIKNIADFTEEHDEKLKENEKLFKKLNKELLEKEKKELNSQIAELSKNIQKIKIAQRDFTKKDWDDVKKCNAELQALKGKEQKSISEVAETNGVKFYESEEFQDFIKSAEEYIKILGDDKYPEGKIDTCVYCQQELSSKKANALLKNYRQILNDDTQEKLKAVKRKKKIILDKIADIEAKITFTQLTFGEDDDSNAIQPAEIKEYNKKIKSLFILIADNEIEDDIVFDLQYDKYINYLDKKIIALGKALTAKKDSWLNIVGEERELLSKINELKDRKLLSSKTEEIKKAIKNHKIATALSKGKSSFSSASISKKTTEARDELIAGNFNTIFLKELKALNKSHIDIQLDFGTSKGKSKVRQKLNTSYNLTDILSEGEQKAIALAEFLTELQLENSFSPVIFDDPVNSLDHNIIDEVAKRLTELSEKKQVVIFTHSILLFYSLIHQKELSDKLKSGIEFTFYSSRTEYEQSGILDDADEINTYIYYEKQIKKIINAPDKTRKESDVASDGYGHLRSAIELAVEGSVFQDAVRRYRKNVGFGNLLRVNGKLIDENKGKINDIFERCCKYIKGHSHPKETLESPTLKALTSDFNDFTAIRSLFNKN